MLARRQEALAYTGKLVVGTLPAIFLVLLAKDFLTEQFSNPMTVAVCLMLTGGILWTTRRSAPLATLREPSWLAALLIGCGQAFAILPGISRSGTTVAVALLLGLAPTVAAEFSFLLGIVAITGAAVMAIPDLAGASAEVLHTLALGAVAALVSGVAAIWLFIRMLERQIFHYFAFYAWTAGGLFMIWLLI